MSWTPWKDVHASTDHLGTALYRIRLSKDRRAIPIDRFLGVDKLGILCMGMTQNLESRRRDFLAGLRDSSGNPEGNLLKLIEMLSIFRKQFRGCVYELSYAVVDSKWLAKSEEQRLMKAYFKKFGEVPPMNSALPGRRDKRGW